MPLNSIKTGLKEWAVTSDALASGEQIFLLRKGGIREDGRHFKIESEKFLLYPGLFHEGDILLKNEYRHMLNSTSGADFTQEIPLSVYCELFDTVDISGEENINALYEYHIWSKKFPINRLSWKPSQPLKLMIIRAYRMQSPVLMPVEHSYKGCKSWVDFSREIDVSDVTPAVESAEFHNRINTIYDALNITPING